MADSKQNHLATADRPGAPSTSHRRVLSDIDKSPGSASDRDGTTDDEFEALGSSPNGEEADSLLDISISQSQAHMRSRYTPAFEKAQALEASRDYFEAVDGTAENEDTIPPRNFSQNGQQQHDVAQHLQPTPWKSRPELANRTSFTRTAIGSGQTEGRQRSSSGPTGIMENIKKMFNDFPSYPGFGSGGKEEGNDNSGKPERPSLASHRTRSNRSTTVALPSSPLRHGIGLDGTAASSESYDPRPRALRRVTSDNSLYLRRAATGASDFDDTTTFARVAEMQNSRLKAITDSLADSSLKMPKIPSINFNNARNSPSRTDSEGTKRNSTWYAPSNDPSHLSGQNNNVPNGEKKHPLLTEALSQMTGDVVFMGGYRGSVLRSAEFPHHQLWVPVKVGLNIRKVDLEVGLSHEDEERMEEKIIPSGMLSHIGPIDISRRLIKKVRKCTNARTNLLRVHDWGYDWRLSPHFLTEKLIKFLESLECNHPETPLEKRGALVIAHSLGGLITRHAVNQRPELFSGVVYAGTPQNCCNILGPLRNGDDVLLSSRVLTAQVNFTLRTSYALLPENGRCFLNKQTGERYDIDFFDIDSWDQYRLSPCIGPCFPPYVQSQPKKGIMESLGDTISSYSPSLPNKSSLWFSNSTYSNDQISPPYNGTTKDKASNVGDGFESATKASNGKLQSPAHQAQDSMEPSMKPSKNKPSVATSVTIPKDKARQYLIRTLGEVKQFKAELNHMPALQDANFYPPHAIIYGKSVPTVYGAKVASRDAIKCADAYDDLAFAAGDGVVLASAAQLPVGYRYVKGGRVESDRGHIGLLGDLEGIGKCISAVVEGRRRGIGFGMLAD